VKQVFNSWATQVVRLYADQPFLEFEYTIGPIGISDGLGKEVITRYATQGFPTGQTWYTDSQGLEMQKRRHNYRPTWPYKATEPVAGNYYPMNAAALLRSDSLNAQITYRPLPLSFILPFVILLLQMQEINKHIIIIIIIISGGLWCDVI